MNRRRTISLVDKQRIVDAYNNPNVDYVEVAATLDIPRGTAWSIVNRYLEDGEVVVRRRGGGRGQVANEEMVACLVECVEQHPAYTLCQLNQELRVRMPASPPISDTTIHR